MIGIKTVVALTIGAGAFLALSDGGRRWLDGDAAGLAPVVRVVPATATIASGDSLQLSAALLDDDGNEISGQRFTWWSPDPRVATVDETGLVVALETGSVTIAAITEDRSHSGFADITVVAERPTQTPTAHDADPAAGAAAVTAGAGSELDPQAAPGEPVITASGTDAAGPGPNEPPGYIEQVRRTFDDYNENGWRDRHHGGRQAISNGVMRITYPTGFVGGSAPGQASVYFGKQSGGFRSVYLAHDFILSPNWQGHGSAQNKVWYYNTPDGSKSILTVKAYGGTGATEFPMVPTAGQTKNSVNGRGKGSNLYPNMGGPKIQRGRRAFVEMIVTMNSAPGRYDGELHIWIDGAKTHEFTPARGNGINWYDAGEGSRIGQLKWTPVWGGVGNRVQQPMYMEMSGIYISAR